MIYETQGNTIKALKYMHKALRIQEKLKNKSAISQSYRNIARLYKNQNNLLKSKDYYHKSLLISNEQNNQIAIGEIQSNLALIFKKQGAIDSAITYLQNATKIFKKIGYKLGLATSYGNIANIYKEKGSYAIAMEFYKSSMITYQEIGEKKGEVQIYLNMAEVYDNLDQSKNAFEQGEIALSMAKRLWYPYLIKEAANILAALYEKEENYKMAHEMNQLFHQMRDTITNEETMQATIEQEMKYKYEKKFLADSIQNIEASKIKDAQLLAQKAEIEQEKTIIYGMGLGLIITVVFLYMILNRFKVTKRQKEVIEKKNKQITESIQYAKRIQEASLTSDDYISKYLKEYFIFYQPRDIVSGDFYWVYEINPNKIMIAVCDCTGHGVPGALMSMISTSLLNETVIENGITKADKVLDNLRQQIIKALKQDKDNAQTLDGLDMTLLVLDKKERTAEFASAGHTLYINSNGNIKEIKGNAFPVGYFFGRIKAYSTKSIEFQKGDIIYMSSDGFTEQFGGKNNKMFGYAKFKKLLLDNLDKPMDVQKNNFYQAFNNWKGGRGQIDDVCVMGIKIE